MNPYSKFVGECARNVVDGRSLPFGGFGPAARVEIPPDAPKVLFFAPHPDDETIQGGLALRLLREAKWNVIDVAVTLGSNPERKAARWQELRGACEYLGFGLESDRVGRIVERAGRDAGEGASSMGGNGEGDRWAAREAPAEGDIFPARIGLEWDAYRSSSSCHGRAGNSCPRRVLSHRNGILGADARAEPDGGILQ